MKSIVFDTGPIISLTTNNLLGLLNKLKEHYNGNFYITKAIKNELIERPLATKKFKFEALQVLRCINAGLVKVFNSKELRKTTLNLLNLANTSFKAREKYMQIVHFAEIEGIAAAIINKSDAFAVDERNTRLLIEDPIRLKKILGKRLHTQITVNKKSLDEFRNLTKNIKLIRSVELVTIAYELGLLDKYIVNIKNPRKALLEGVLWGVKLNGASVSEKEIKEIVKMEIK
jgi:signal recognition particle subunit SEC65